MHQKIKCREELLGLIELEDLHLGRPPEEPDTISSIIYAPGVDFYEAVRSIKLSIEKALAENRFIVAVREKDKAEVYADIETWSLKEEFYNRDDGYEIQIRELSDALLEIDYLEIY